MASLGSHLGHHRAMDRFYPGWINQGMGVPADDEVETLDFSGERSFQFHSAMRENHHQIGTLLPEAISRFSHRVSQRGYL